MQLSPSLSRGRFAIRDHIATLNAEYDFQEIFTFGYSR